jgi:hypothetical protein
MATIEIPFSREMAIAAIDGLKIATTRSEVKGKIGDTFSIEDVRETEYEDRHAPLFRLIDIIPVQLYVVKNMYFRLEGVGSPSAFEQTWRELHRGEFDETAVKYMHIFGRIA